MDALCQSINGSDYGLSPSPQRGRLYILPRGMFMGRALIQAEPVEQARSDGSKPLLPTLCGHCRQIAASAMTETPGTALMAHDRLQEPEAPSRPEGLFVRNLETDVYWSMANNRAAAEEQAGALEPPGRDSRGKCNEPTGRFPSRVSSILARSGRQAYSSGHRICWRQLKL